MRTSPSEANTDPPAQANDKHNHRLRKFVTVLLVVSMLLTTIYMVVSGYIVTQLVQQAQSPLHSTPTDFHLQFRDISFTSREDHLSLVGWFLPGMRPDGSLTTQRAVIMVHGYPGNRATESVGMLAIANQFVHHGFAVLMFDLRAAGKSAPAPVSMGYFEQRDVLGAVDFLQSGPLPYPQLGRPQTIVGWGVSMGAATLLLAAAREPAIRAVVSDCGYGDLLAMLRMSLPNHSNVPSLFTLGVVVAARAIYGVDLAAVRPVDVVKNLAPRPVLFIQADNDTTVPPAQMEMLARSARSAPDAHVQTWMLTGGIEHAQSFTKLGDIYTNRIIAFYTAAVGPLTSVAASQS